MIKFLKYILSKFEQNTNFSIVANEYEYLNEVAKKLSDNYARLPDSEILPDGIGVYNILTEEWLGIDKEENGNTINSDEPHTLFEGFTLDDDNIAELVSMGKRFIFWDNDDIKSGNLVFVPILDGVVHFSEAHPLTQ